MVSAAFRRGTRDSCVGCQQSFSDGIGSRPCGLTVMSNIAYRAGYASRGVFFYCNMVLDLVVPYLRVGHASLLALIVQKSVGFRMEADRGQPMPSARTSLHHRMGLWISPPTHKRLNHRGCFRFRHENSGAAAVV